VNWDARQRAMLEAMGLRVFERQVVAEPMHAAAALATVEAPPRRTAPPASMPSARTEWAGLDLPALREAVAGCRACPLGEQRRQAVFGSGSERPRWLILTEPPDEAADQSGEPLSGAPGKLLDHMLAAVGLRREEVFVTPVVKCRPPRGRAAAAAEVAACGGVLQRQLELLQPHLVLAMGRQSAQALTGASEPLGRLRGQLHRAQELPLVATYDPAYLLRSPADKAGAWDDLCRAAEAQGS
jgi:DNA polymerase